MWGQPESTPWFFNSQTQTEACHRLQYQIENNEPLAILEGSFGSGKSTVLRQLATQLRRQRCQVMMLSVAALDDTSLLWHIASALSVPTGTADSQGRLLCLIRDELAGRTACGQRTVLLLDDVNLAGEGVDAVLHGLIATARQCAGRVAVVAASEQPLSSDLQRISALPVRLAEFAKEESVQFLRQHLSRRTHGLEPVDDAAIQAALANNDLSPGRLLRLSDALTAVRLAHPDLTIDAHVVRETARELVPRRAG